MQFGSSPSATYAGPDHRSDADRARADQGTVAIAKKAEEIGLDVFATGKHHNPPFVASSPTTTLAYIAAQTSGSSSRPRPR